MASIRKRGSNSYLIVVSRGYGYEGNGLKSVQKTVKTPKEYTPKQAEKWVKEQAILFEREVQHTPEPINRSITLAKYSELLGGDAFRNMLEVLRMKYDYVIVDTPPLGSVIDAAIVGAICDGTVIVVESGAISYKFVQNVKEQLNKVGCRILGCVLNKVNTKKNPYYGKYYGHYYGNYYGNGQDGTEEAQEDLTPDAGSKTDGTAAETKTAVPGQNTGEKESAK